MLNNLIQSLLLVLSVLVFAACGLSPAPEDLQPNHTPTTLLSTALCDTQPCDWLDLGINPLNSSMGSSATFPVLAVDPTGAPAVAYYEISDGIRVRRWNGNDWSWIGGLSVSIPGSANATEHALFFGASGTPWVGFNLNLSQPKVTRFNGSEWVYLPNPPCANFSGSSSFALGSDGQPVVVCQEINPRTRGNRLRVNRYNGSSWVSLPFIENAMLPKVEVDQNNRIVVAFKDQPTNSLKVHRSQGNRWKSLGTPSLLTYAGHALKIDAQGNPVVVDREMVGGQLRLVVKRYNGSAFLAVGPAIRDLFPQNASSVPTLAVQGTAISVGFVDNDTMARVVTFDPISNSWMQKGDTVNASSGIPAGPLHLVHTPGGDLLATWHGNYVSNLRYSVFVRRWGVVTP